MPLRLGIWGRGRLGGAIAATEDDAITVIWHLDRRGTPSDDVDVVIDASVATAVSGHLDWAVKAGVPVVIAATGWRMDDLAARVGDATGVVVAPNGSLTVALMTRLAGLFGAFAETMGSAEGWLLDHHHSGKLDAPSGTALCLAEAFRRRAGSDLPIASLRAGHEIGNHILGLDAAGETLELHHRVRSRATFASGLLCAARWLRGRRGVFSMEDVACDVLGPLFQSLTNGPLQGERE